MFTIKYLFHILPCPFIVPLQKCHCQSVLIIIRNQHVKAQLNRTWIFKGDLQVFFHMLCWSGWIRDILTFGSFQLSPVLLQLFTRRTSRNADFCPRSCALYICLSIKYSACFTGRQNIKVLAGAGNPYKTTLFPSYSNSRQAKPVNNGDCPRTQLCLQWREYESAKDRHPLTLETDLHKPMNRPNEES